MCNQGATSSKVQKVHLIVMLTKWELQLCKEAKKHVFVLECRGWIEVLQPQKRSCTVDMAADTSVSFARWQQGEQNKYPY